MILNYQSLSPTERLKTISESNESIFPSEFTSARALCSSVKFSRLTERLKINRLSADVTFYKA